MPSNAVQPQPDLAKLLAPRSVAVVGASARPTATGSRVIENLRELGGEAVVYPVNPKYEELGGLRCYPSLAAIEDDLDCVFVGVPVESGPDVLAEAAARGIP